MSLSFDLVWKFVMFWMVLAVFTGIANLSFAVFEPDQLIEVGLQPEEVNLDRPSVGGDPISTNVIVPSSSKEWVTFMFKAAKLDSNVWQGWSNFIRIFFLVGSAVFGIFMIRDGINTLTGFVGRP